MRTDLQSFYQLLCIIAVFRMLLLPFRSSIPAVNSKQSQSDRIKVETPVRRRKHVVSSDVRSLVGTFSSTGLRLSGCACINAVRRDFSDRSTDAVAVHLVVVTTATAMRPTSREFVRITSSLRRVLFRHLWEGNSPVSQVRMMAFWLLTRAINFLLNRWHYYALLLLELAKILTREHLYSWNCEQEV